MSKPITENPDVQRLIAQVVQLQIENKRLREERSKIQHWVNYHNLSVKYQELQAENDKLKEALEEMLEFSKYAGACKKENTQEYIDEFFRLGLNAQQRAIKALKE